MEARDGTLSKQGVLIDEMINFSPLGQLQSPERFRIF